MPFLLSPARLDSMLREDAPFGDMTTLALGIGERPGRAMLRAGAAMTLCCVEEAEQLFLLAGCTSVRRFATSGCQLEQGADILLAEGPSAALHLATRTAQVLMAGADGSELRRRHAGAAHPAGGAAGTTGHRRCLHAQAPAGQQ